MLHLPQHLLWEYDLTTFDYAAAYRLVIERVIQRGNIVEWREAQNYYGKERFLEVARSSRQLSDRDRSLLSGRQPSLC